MAGSVGDGVGDVEDGCAADGDESRIHAALACVVCPVRWPDSGVGMEVGVVVSDVGIEMLFAFGGALQSVGQDVGWTTDVMGSDDIVTAVVDFGYVVGDYDDGAVVVVDDVVGTLPLDRNDAARMHGAC